MARPTRRPAVRPTADMVSLSAYTKLAVLGTVLALGVIVLGAFVRLSNAGLSCPDWPGCYGQVLVPQTRDAVQAANRAFPERPLDVGRAWKEMVHRYLAGLLGVVVAALAALAWRRRRMPGQQVVLPFALFALVVFQAVLGMWTVTLLLKPLVVMGHLLGGVTTAALLWWLALRQGRLFTGSDSLVSGGGDRSLPRLVLVGVAILYAQIALGGWTSANYAALACPDFPLCQGRLLPPLDFVEALRPWRGLGINYEGGVLENDARVTIHLLHRLGAALTLGYLLWMAVRCLREARSDAARWATATVIALTGLQVALGVAIVVHGLPLMVAIAHNANAALLLLAVVSVYHIARPPGAAL